MPLPRLNPRRRASSGRRLRAAAAGGQLRVASWNRKRSGSLHDEVGGGTKALSPRHPTPEALAHWLLVTEGEAGTGRIDEAVGRHLERCASCKAEVEALLAFEAKRGL